MFFLAIYSEQQTFRIAFLKLNRKEITIEHVQSFSDNVKPLYMLQTLLEGKKTQIVSGLEASSIFLRTLSLNLKSKREILAALPFQVEGVIPYPKEDIFLIPSFFPEKGKETKIFLLATSKTAIRDHLSLMQGAEIDPAVVSCIPIALFRFAQHFFPTYPDLCVHYLNDKQSLFVVIKEGKLHSAHDTPFARMQAYLEKNHPEIRNILLTGDAIHEGILSPLELVDPTLKKYAIPLGLALDATKGDVHSVQFRQKEFLSYEAEKKRKQLFFSYFGACISFILLVFCIGHFHLNKRENLIVEAVAPMGNAPLKKIVDELEVSIDTSKKIPVPLSSLPKMGEVLSWLSTHPLLKESKIQLLKYAQGKVELELLIEKPSDARGFHEALLKDTQMIDHKKEVQWSADHGIYRTHFYLKNRPL